MMGLWWGLVSTTLGLKAGGVPSQWTKVGEPPTVENVACGCEGSEGIETVYTGSGEWLEGTTRVTWFRLVEALESRQPKIPCPPLK